MPKIISTKLQITSISAKGDGSLRLSAVTPELKTPEKAEFLELQNIELNALLEPVDYTNLSNLVVEKDLDTKSPSERLRNVLFAIWATKTEAGENLPDFSEFYRNVYERLIDNYKSKLDEMKGI